MSLEFLRISDFLRLSAMSALSIGAQFTVAISILTFTNTHIQQTQYGMLANTHTHTVSFSKQIVIHIKI